MINKSLKLLAVLAAFTAGPLFAQDTYFSYDFEFEGADAVGFPLFELNEFEDSGELVGSWSGDDFQPGDPSSQFAADCSEDCPSVGIVNTPYEGNESILFIDRPNMPATHFMNLTEAIDLPGAEFTVTVATRRTGGGTSEPKAYDFFGVDSDGNESFRIRILADGSTERLGYVTDGGDTVVKDLPTTQGEDMPDDIANTGGPPLGENDDVAQLNVRLGVGGYTVVYTNLNGSNSYTTDTLAYNGPGTDLAQVGLSYGANLTNTNEQVGFFVDDVLVTGFQDLLLGDFDQDGDIDLEDFMELANNFGTASTDGDYDFNGKVDLADWVGFFAAYQAANGAAEAQAVPEPSSSLLVCFGSLVGLLARRRRR